MSGITALEAVKRIKNGELSAVTLCEACLTHLREADTTGDFHVPFDEQALLNRAQTMDDIRRAGNATGVLHGIPVVVDETFGATGPENERQQSAVVHRLKEAGAVVIGQATHDRVGRLVAQGSVPLGVGLDSQNNVISQAAKAGCVGFVPSRGTIPRQGCQGTSISLDQIGVFGLTIEDSACLVDAIAGYDAQDQACYLAPKPRMLDGAHSQAPVAPAIAWFERDQHRPIPEDHQAAFEELLQVFDGQTDRLQTPGSFATALEHGQSLQTLESPNQAIKNEISASDAWLAAHSMVEASVEYFHSFFVDYDAIVAPCVFSDDENKHSLWSIAGLPRLSLPWMESESGAPIGVQLIGLHRQEDRLLRTASWLNKTLSHGCEKIT